MKKRLDELLAAQGLVTTRSRARDAIRRGLVTVDGAVVTKPGAPTAETARLTVAPEAGTEYVSRGALKLVAALDRFNFDPMGRTIVDAGASTGGFTEVLLERGASRVYAVDVGHGQLHPRIAARPEVVSIENADIRTFEPGTHVDAVVADLSFISLEKVLPHLMRISEPRGWIVALVKPQFEVGRASIGKGGIVRDEVARRRALQNLADLVAATPGWRLLEIIPSPIEGGSGNMEYLMGIVRDGG